MSKKAWDNVARLIGYLWVADFVLLIVFMVVLGGDAQSGYVTNGHYFVGYKSRFTEVSRSAYLFSWWQVASLFIGFLLLAITGYLAGWHTDRDIQY